MMADRSRHAGPASMAASSTVSGHLPGDGPARLLPADADPTRLWAHAGHCAAARSGLHRLGGAVSALHGLVQPRFLSTTAVLILLLLALALLGSALGA